MPSPAPEKAESFHYCVAEKVLWVKAAKGVCSTWKGQQVCPCGAQTDVVSRKKMEELASLSSLFILIGKSIEARFYSKVPATLPWIFGTRSGAEWSPVAPSCLSSVSHQASVSKGDTQTWGGVTQGSQIWEVSQRKRCLFGPAGL